MKHERAPRVARRRTRCIAACAAALVLAAGCASVQADGSHEITSRTSATESVGEAAITQSGVTEPAVTQSGATAPAVTETAVTDPVVTEPAPTEPPVTEPAPTEPPTITVVPPGRPQTPADELALPSLELAVSSLIDGNLAGSVTVIRDHERVFGEAFGAGASQQPVTPDTPLVLASVSKLVTMLTVARLVERGDVDLDAPVPWTSMYLNPDPAWNTVTVRELLSHTSGMPVARAKWLNTPGSCAISLAEEIARPPTATRGTWRYSNGNYCALGLLIEVVTGESRDDAADELVFDPIGVTGPHLTTDGLRADDGPYAEGVARLERLGGAGTWLASSDDVALMLDSFTPADVKTLAWPAIITDQYGWGHTGTIDGAKACAWVMEGGRTVVVGIVSGNRPSTGGRVCDVIVPALANDLGIWADKPMRTPD